MIKVLIADDQALIRQAVGDILDSADDMSVVGQAIDGRDAVAQCIASHPDVVVMDIRMPGLDGIGATEQIVANAELKNVKVLILTTFEKDEYLVSALKAGASGFVGKGAEPEDIMRAVRAVHAGDALLSPNATRNLIDHFIAGRPGLEASEVPGLTGLTEREQEVLLMVARGKSNQEIADELVISPYTAKTHVNRVMAKLGAHDRAQLVIIAYESGLLVPGA